MVGNMFGEEDTFERKGTMGNNAMQNTSSFEPYLGFLETIVFENTITNNLFFIHNWQPLLIAQNNNMYPLYMIFPCDP